MSEEIQKRSKWFKCQNRVIAISFIAILLMLVIGHLVTYNIINNQKHNNEELISQILINASKEKALIPDLIFIEPKDSVLNKKELNDSLKIAILEFIAKKYTQNADVNNTFNISPYILNSEIKNEEKIIKHIEFLNSTVTKAVEDSKNQVDTEISKINTWISIWIGIIGFLGIFFPLIINIKSLDELKDLKDNLVSSKSEIDRIDSKIITHELTITSLNSKTKNIENIVTAIKLISKLKDIDDKFLIYNKEPGKFIAITLEELKKELDSIQFIENSSVIKDVLHQLSYRLYSLSTYTFVKKATMEEMLRISEDIVSALEHLSQENYNNIMQKIFNLTKMLKS